MRYWHYRTATSSNKCICAWLPQSRKSGFSLCTTNYRIPQRKHEWKRTHQLEVPAIYARLSGNILAVDENIGRLLKYLEEIGELDNTIIVYTSDQGFFLGEHGWFDKRFMYEECQRMPFIIRYPKAIKARSTSNAICMNVDFAPTFLDYAGIEIRKIFKESL